MLRRVNLWLFHGVLLVLLQGCGGCGEDEPGPAPVPIDRDSGNDEEDAAIIDAGDSPIDVPDASELYPGEPPEELADENCAAHTNKIYELSTTSGNAQAVQVAAFAGRFGIAYVTTSDVMCATGVGFAEMFGVPGANEPEPMRAYDACTLVEQAAIARGDDAWLIAIVDNRQDARDLWVHAFDPETGNSTAPHRITENMAGEGAVELVRIDNGRALIAWAQTAFDNSGTSLNVQMLSGEGEPLGEPVQLEEPAAGFYTSLSMVLLGEQFIGLAYIHDDGAGGMSAVLDVLDQETGERLAERDPWVLTTEPGTNGTIELAADRNGAGVAYTLVQGTSRQIWFQGLRLDGSAGPTNNTGGGMAEPMRVIENPQLGIDVSLAKLATGYAVAYRALPSVGVTVPQIRVHFLDTFGRIIGESGIALAEQGGGQTAIEAGSDGRVVLSWMDTDEEGVSTLRALMMPCGS